MKNSVLFYILLLIEILTAIVGGFRYRNLPRPLRILEWLIIISILDVGLQLTLAFYHIHNLWTSHFYTLVEIVFVVLMYSSWLKKSQNRLMLSLCLSVFVVFWIVSKFTFEPLSLLDGWTAAISKVLLITFSAFIFVDIVRESDIVWVNDPRFWVAVGIIIYSAGSLFYYALFNIMLHASPDRLRIVLSMNRILIIVSSLLYMRGFLCKR
ncbi:MAG: hypothetical protein NTX44_13180 [Ignavibacteriales bacterium]|nr:hypothetical protein [Ignavibacteriales bacterium]